MTRTSCFHIETLHTYIEIRLQLIKILKSKNKHMCKSLKESYTIMQNNNLITTQIFSTMFFTSIHLIHCLT